MQVILYIHNYGISGSWASWCWLYYKLNI